MSTITFDFRHYYRKGERRESDQIAYQWDLGHVAEIYVPVNATYEIHYCFADFTETDDYGVESITAAEDGGYKLTAHIPNELFERSGELKVYVIGADDNHVLTTYEGYITIRGRAKPEDYVDDDPENEATRILTEAREARDAAVEAAEQAEAAASQSAAQASIAEVYDATATYAIGDYCLHDGQLYECTAEITTPEAWTAAHWTAATVGTELNDIKGGVTGLKEDFSDLTSSAYLKVIDLQKVDGKYIGVNGNILDDTGMCYAVLPVSVGDILVLTTNPSGIINAISYSATETLSSSLERVVLGTGNTVQTYTWNVDKNGYAVVSGTTESVSVKISRKYLRNQTGYDIYIAGSNSAHKAEADFVCTGENDDEIINKALAIPSVKSVYFYSDSIFSLSAPIVLRSGQTIKSNGAVFTQPAMVTTELTSANIDVTSHLLRVSSVQGFKAGQYVYIQDDNGQNMSNIIASVYSAGNSSITFVNQIDYKWTPEYNTVIKTANPCFVLNHVDTVTIDGVHIDWNVAENPIQLYNPYFLQEGISVQYSQNIHINNCKIENGGRRGICTTDALNVIISNCFIRNWHEHAIDIFNGYRSEGNTRENPMLNNCIINNVICTDNKMHGIQLHRGSGVIVSNCVSFANEQADISMAEYAHDNIVSNCFVHDGFVGIIVRGGSFNNLIRDNIIKGYSKTGIWLRGTSDNRGLRNTLSGNKISNIVGNGINIEYSDYCRVESNELFDISDDMSLTLPILCALSGYNVVLNNMVRIATASSIYGIRCAGAGADYNVVKGNILENCGAPSTTGSHDVVADNIVR